jgi:hypothetical protein
MLLSVVLFTACAALPCVAEAQPQDSQTQQDQSVADAARRRETRCEPVGALEMLYQRLSHTFPSAV